MVTFWQDCATSRNVDIKIQPEFNALLGPCVFSLACDIFEVFTLVDFCHISVVFLVTADWHHHGIEHFTFRVNLLCIHELRLTVYFMG